MKKIVEILFITCIVSLIGRQALAERKTVKQHARSMKVEFSHPERPGTLKIHGGEGDITISGYDGKEVLIDISSDEADALPPEDNEKAKGLKRIAGSSFNVEKIDDDNTIVILSLIHI